MFLAYQGDDVDQSQCRRGDAVRVKTPAAILPSGHSTKRGTLRAAEPSPPASADTRSVRREAAAAAAADRERAKPRRGGDDGAEGKCWRPTREIGAATARAR